MRCPICDTQENWHSLKELHSKKELRVCNTCGFVGFKIEEGEEEKTKDYYRFQYRPAPGYGNLVTTAHKQNYIINFLSDYLKEKKDLVIGDVGCATGYLVAYFRRIGHKATGSEYTLTFRRFAEHFYGIPITEELMDDLKYDLITIYHVAEHMIDPDKKLTHYRGLLKEDGHMLISTPKWYDSLEEASGPAITSFENLWHENHINIYSERSIKNLFKKVGLEIVKEDHFVYGQTYLVKKAEPQPLTKGDYENPQEIIEKTKLSNEAIKLFLAGKFKEAKELYPKFPDAWVSLIINTYGKDSGRQEDAWIEAFKALPRNKKLLTIYSAVYLFQRARYPEAIKILNDLITVCPDEDKFMVLGQSYAMLGEHKKAMDYFFRSADMNPTKWQIAMDFMGKEASMIPAWDEVQLQQLGEKVVRDAKPKLKLIDPIFSSTNGKEKETLKEEVSK